MDPNLLNIILVIVLVAIVGLATLYIYKSKKAGAVCIGCPYAKQCGKKSSSCGCGSNRENYSCCDKNNSNNKKTVAEAAVTK